MEVSDQAIIAIFCALLTSSGFWAFISRKSTRKSAERDLLIGLAHDRIMDLGLKYIERGYITQEEYENFYEYLYKPYENAGGNGSAKRIMQEVNKLPIHDTHHGSRLGVAHDAH